MTPLLSVEDLKVSFSTRHGVVHALRGVSFTLDQGETLGIVGESGSGKSVTALAVMRLLDRAGRVTAGHIRFRGEDITAASRSIMQPLRGAAMSMIFQTRAPRLIPSGPLGIRYPMCSRRIRISQGGKPVIRLWNYLKPCAFAMRGKGLLPIRMNYQGACAKGS
jgi:ABC-type antimicrobial peptide transport system ATPase subunit